MRNDSEGYRVAKAFIHLKKARSILKEIQVSNDKIEGNFTALMNYCGDFITTHKHRSHDERSGISQET
jgi:hypothetical protein